MDNGSLEMLFDPGDAFSLLGPDAQLDAEQETRPQTQSTGARKSAKSGKKGRGKGGAAAVADGDGGGAAWSNGFSEGNLNASSGSANGGGGGGGGSRKRGHQGTSDDAAPKKKSKGKGAAATKGGGQQKANDAAPPSTTQDTEPWHPESKEGPGKKKRKKTGAGPAQEDPLPSSPPVGPRGQRPSFPYTDLPANSMPQPMRDPSFMAQKEFVDRQVPVQSKWKEGQEQAAGSQGGMMRPKADPGGGFGGGDDFPLMLLDDENLGDLFDDDDGDGMWDALGDMLGKEMPPPGSEEKGPMGFPPPASRAPPPPVPAPAPAPPPRPFKEEPSPPPPQQPLQQCDSFSTTIDQSSVDGDAASVTMELAPPSSQPTPSQPALPKKPKVEYRTVKIRIRCESLPPIKKKATLLARIRLTPPPPVPEQSSVVTTPSPSPARPPKPSPGPKHQKVASFTSVPKMDKARAFEQGKMSKGRSQQLKAAAASLPPASPARGTPQRNRQSATPPRPTQQDAAAGSAGGEGKEPLSHGDDPLDVYMDSECSVTNMWQYVHKAGYFTPLLQALGNPTTLAAAERALSELLPLICDSVVERDSLSRDVGEGFNDMLEQVLLDECSDNHGIVPLSAEEEQSVAWAEQGYQTDLARCPLTCRLLSAFVHVPVAASAATSSADEENERQCCQCGERDCVCDVERNGGIDNGGASDGGGDDDDGRGIGGGGRGDGGGNGSAKHEGGEELLPLPSQDGPTGGGEVAEPSTGSPPAPRLEPSWSPPSAAVHGKCGRGLGAHRGRNGKSALASALAKCAGSDDAEEALFVTSPPLPHHHHHHHHDHQSPDPPPYPPPPTARAPWDVSVLPSPRRRGSATLDERLMDELEDLGMLDPLYDRDRARRLIKAAAHSEHSAARERIEVELGMWLRQDERRDMALCRTHNKTVAMLRAAALDAVKEEMDSRAKHAAQDEACERYQQLVEEKKKKAQADAEQRRLAREKEAAALAAETAQMFPYLGRLTRASDRAEKMLQIQQIQQMEASAAASRGQGGQEVEQQCPLPMDAMAGYEQAATGASVPYLEEEGYSGLVHCKEDDGAVPDFMQFFDK